VGEETRTQTARTHAEARLTEYERQLLKKKFKVLPAFADNIVDSLDSK